MPDIAMCKGTDCPLKEKCFRFTAKPSEYMQSYFITPPNDGDKCDHYWANNKASVKKLEKAKK